MIGAILGDIAGSRFEFAGNRKKPEALFAPDCFPTDDTWLSEAVACALSNSFCEKEATLEQFVLKETICAFVRHPEAGWGLGFVRWIRKTIAENGLNADCLAIYPEKLKYTSDQSAGNGCAMKVASIPYFSSPLKNARNSPAGSRASPTTIRTVTGPRSVLPRASTGPFMADQERKSWKTSFPIIRKSKT